MNVIVVITSVVYVPIATQPKVIVPVVKVPAPFRPTAVKPSVVVLSPSRLPVVTVITESVELWAIVKNMFGTVLNGVLNVIACFPSDAAVTLPVPTSTR